MVTSACASSIVIAGLSLSLVAIGGLDPWVAERVDTLLRGSGRGIPLMLSLAIGIALWGAAWFAASQMGHSARDRAGLAGSGPHKVLFTIACGFEAAALTSPIKLAVGRARPSDVGATEHLQFDLLALGADASFPSTQAAVVGALTMALSLLLPRWRPAFFGLALWIGSPGGSPETERSPAWRNCRHRTDFCRCSSRSSDSLPTRRLNREKARSCLPLQCAGGLR